MKKLTCLFLVCFIVGCKQEDIDGEFPDFSHLRPVVTERGTSLGTARTAQIGPAGGELRSEDGRLTVSVPAGALSSTVTVGVEPISNRAPLGLGSGYRLTPEGVNFAKPVKLTFSYDNAMLRGTASEFLWITSQKPDGTWEGHLNSELDAATHTVSTETSHFSDWVIGKMIDLALTPSSARVKTGDSVDIMVTGFLNYDDYKDELVPLTPVNQGSIGDSEPVPLNDIGRIMQKLDKFVGLDFKEWRLDGVKGPVSNSKGKLDNYGIVATYTAPGKKPSPDNVAVTMTIEARQKDGRTPTISITTPITITDKQFYAKFSFGGTEFEYYTTYEFTTSEAPKGEGSAGVTYQQDQLLLGFSLSDKAAPTLEHGFSIVIRKPVVGMNAIDCYNNEPSVLFGWFAEATVPPFRSYQNLNRNLYTIKGADGVTDICISNDRDVWKCAPVTVTLNEFKAGPPGTVVSGTASGTLHFNNNYQQNCNSKESVSFSGEFYLPLQ